MIIPSARRATPIAIAFAAAFVGSVAAWHYHRLGLTLTHYDARGHLVVARRIIDSITPGWQQIGAVWLPLPHLLNALPVQVDLFYRTGLSAVAISIASFAIAAGAIGWIVLALTGSMSGAVAGAAVFVANPNVLYLQSTPMTEPLLLATTTVAVAMLMSACGAGPFGPADRRVLKTRPTSIAFALACLTRYEAWPATAAAIAVVPWVRWRSGHPFTDGLRTAGAIGIYPALAIVAFAIFSRVVVGQWFVSTDFFVPENKALGEPLTALKEIGWGTQQLSGSVLVWIAGVGLLVVAVRALVRREDAASILPLVLIAMAAVAWSAFVKGHPFRIRYMVPLIAVEAIGAGALAGTRFKVSATPNLRPVFAIVVLVIAAFELRPLDAAAPMVVEAQWDRPNLPLRALVTGCLGPPGRGEKIMASMGSLGHYMQSASASGFAIRDFLHEGNGDIWIAALDDPRPFADWILIEEKAEGGDMLARLSRERPAFLAGYARVCEDAGLALYKRDQGSGVRDQGLGIRDQGAAVRDPTHRRISIPKP